MAGAVLEFGWNRRTAALVAAFAAVYFIWGSTYLAIRFAIDSLPPFLMAGVRFFVAGAVLFAFSRGCGAPKPTRVHWKTSCIAGALMLWIGNGLVVWSEHYITTGMAALLVATTPFFMVLIEWLGPERIRPARSVLLSLILGTVGLLWLIGPSLFAESEQVHLGGAIAVVIASLAWAIGSYYVGKAPDIGSLPLAAGMQMIAGGGLLCLTGLAAGEAGDLDTDKFTADSLWAFAYLIVFGSWVAYLAYGWLLRQVSPTLVSTYAFVNPMVAVLLGVCLGGEELTSNVIEAGAVIIAAVAVLMLTKPQKTARNEEPLLEPPSMALSDTVIPAEIAEPLRTTTEPQPDKVFYPT